MNSGSKSGRGEKFRFWTDVQGEINFAGDLNVCERQE